MLRDKLYPFSLSILLICAVKTWWSPFLVEHLQGGQLKPKGIPIIADTDIETHFIRYKNEIWQIFFKIWTPALRLERKKIENWNCVKYWQRFELHFLSEGKKATEKYSPFAGIKKREIKKCIFGFISTLPKKFFAIFFIFFNFRMKTFQFFATVRFWWQRHSLKIQNWQFIFKSVFFLWLGRQQTPQPCVGVNGLEIELVHYIDKLLYCCWWCHQVGETKLIMGG